MAKRTWSFASRITGVVVLGGCPRIAKIIEMRDKGEYKIRPYKGFRGLCRGEPRVHPTFSDRLPGKGAGQEERYSFHKSFSTFTLKVPFIVEPLTLVKSMLPLNFSGVEVVRAAVPDAPSPDMAGPPLSPPTK